MVSHITAATMFESMLLADPSFAPRWAAFCTEWADETDPPLYLALSSLAEHILDCLGAGRTERFESVFAVVERWHVEGDLYVAEAASIGLLESLQNLAGGNRPRPATVEQWLGPESRRWWDKLDRYWAGNGRARSTPD
ncbi:hypothetical protein [Sphingomonas sp.]|uniref:DUF7674 family protein n=1 Tax=Sphingomonas sp. TaxID=28214 RepID=UPI001D66D0B7|nr:hypothetical protein [Sphingomonas sp.]MBX9797626.1 hypothetical protein [Sphingomonas sp.]